MPLPGIIRLSLQGTDCQDENATIPLRLNADRGVRRPGMIDFKAVNATDEQQSGCLMYRDRCVFIRSV